MVKNLIKKLLMTSSGDQLKKLGKCGNGVVAEENITFGFPDRIQLGNHVYIGPRCFLDGRGGLEIHDHVIIAPEVAIMTAIHNYKHAAMVPYDAKELLKPVKVERCVWIGMRVIIMPGVTLGEGSIVGAGAVVTKSCPPGSILGGNPAVIIGTRDMDHYNDCVNKEQFYLKIKQQTNMQKTEVR